MSHKAPPPPPPPPPPPWAPAGSSGPPSCRSRRPARPPRAPAATWRGRQQRGCTAAVRVCVGGGWGVGWWEGWKDGEWGAGCRWRGKNSKKGRRGRGRGKVGSASEPVSVWATLRRLSSTSFSPAQPCRQPHGVPAPQGKAAGPQTADNPTATLISTRRQRCPATRPATAPLPAGLPAAPCLLPPCHPTGRGSPSSPSLLPYGRPLPHVRPRQAPPCQAATPPPAPLFPPALLRLFLTASRRCAASPPPGPGAQPRCHAG